MKPTSLFFQRRVGWLIVLGLAIVQLAAFAYWASVRQTVGIEAEELQKRATALQETVNRLEAAQKRLESDRRVVLSVLEQCRKASDIPGLGESHVVSYHKQGGNSVCLYVPEGSHTLEIVATWKPQRLSNNKAENEGLTDAKSWRVPLLPASGYQLDLANPGGPIRWVLASNHPDFETQRRKLPLDAIPDSYSLSMPKSVFHVPDSRPPDDGGTSPSKLLLMRSDDDGHIMGRILDVKIEVLLFSAHPSGVSANK